MCSKRCKLSVFAVCSLCEEGTAPALQPSAAEDSACGVRCKLAVQLAWEERTDPALQPRSTGQQGLQYNRECQSHMVPYWRTHTATQELTTACQPCMQAGRGRDHWPTIPKRLQSHPLPWGLDLQLDTTLNRHCNGAHVTWRCNSVRQVCCANLAVLRSMAQHGTTWRSSNAGGWEGAAV